MLEILDIFSQKRLLVTALATIALSFLIICLLAPLVHAQNASISASIQSTYDNQGPEVSYDGPNEVTNALYKIGDGTKNTADTAKINFLTGVMTFSSGVTKIDRSIVSGVQRTMSFAVQGVSIGAVAVGRIVGGVFGFAWNTGGRALGLIKIPHFMDSIVRPKDDTKQPTIAQIRKEQATIIQRGTKKVSVVTLASSKGGACDNGSGNGGYPAAWCNAPMDTIQTVPYSRDRINRECTSYAFWYFTKIGGHTNFRVTGNAKYWASNSNYPTHSTPAAGSIGVETGGAYGHVVIIRALPGQKYSGRVVPKGFVLVSEMNYDWNGHFRYSYSPINKFAAFIY